MSSSPLHQSYPPPLTPLPPLRYRRRTFPETELFPLNFPRRSGLDSADLEADAFLETFAGAGLPSPRGDSLPLGGAGLYLGDCAVPEEREACKHPRTPPFRLEPAFGSSRLSRLTL